MIIFKQKVLVIASHPDDEVLGCGGTIAKLVEAGLQVRIAFLADGVNSRKADKGILENELIERRAAARKACGLLGVADIYFGNFLDNEMDKETLLTITRKVEEIIDDFLPDTIFTHHVGDVNIDHQLTHKAVVTACRPQIGKSVKNIFSFETPSSTEWQLPYSAPAFVPNCFIDITNTLSKKLEALDAYSFEMRIWPHSRSIKAVEHLVRWHGASIGTEAAEAFMICRSIL
jgi:LmbE family N-acetylglucosaminyl deacetylase